MYLLPDGYDDTGYLSAEKQKQRRKGNVILILVLAEFTTSELPAFSRNNLDQYTDDKGRLYIIYTVAQVEKSMCCSHPTAVKYLKNLTEIGLIERVRQGMGKPTITYVKDFASVVRKVNEHGANNMRSNMAETNEDEQKLKNLTSRSKEIELHEVKKVNSRKIDSSNTDFSNNPSLQKDNVMLGKRKNICLTGAELEGLREDYGTRLDKLLDECSDRIFGRGDGQAQIKNYYRYIQTIAKTLGYETDAELAIAQAKKKAAEEARRQREESQAAAELESWYEEKMQEYGVATKEEVDRISEENNKAMMEKWRRGDFFSKRDMTYE